MGPGRKDLGVSGGGVAPPALAVYAGAVMNDGEAKGPGGARGPRTAGPGAARRARAAAALRANLGRRKAQARQRRHGTLPPLPKSPGGE